ncbi:MAG: hypothetical protein N2561_07690 [Bacteroidetes bacterium]|nr:hypothetical protein [Rhodothermia bacterium]MCS7155507.1 hypothetical protein [Bacteroidota bacterium]MCX7907400.1 hypothetical protein [Bacteroidota bacterium]MDW8138394.1 hypothetical protein [Bacteroidota bacterium]MDW8284669.1 hypothetical protein [Bacteroidota bacterium]
MVSFSLEAISRQLERFAAELGREYYLSGSGQKEQAELVPIFERYAELWRPEALERLRELSQGLSSQEEAREARYLALDLLGSLVSHELRADLEALENAELRAEIRLPDGRSLSYRQAAVALVNEPERNRRRQLYRARLEVTAQLNPLRIALHRRTHELVEALWGAPLLEALEELRGHDARTLRQKLERFAEETEDMYRELLSWYVGKRLGLELAQLERHDLAHLLRGHQYDSYFPAERLWESARRFVRAMGLDETAGGRVRLDLEARPRKSPRAFCVPVRVPEEIYLVIMPHGGVEDYEALLHELGHALHFGYTRSDLPYAFRMLGDNSVTEGFAMTFDQLVQEPIWLRKVVGVERSEEVARFLLFQELALLRRYAGKIAYELELHARRGDVGGMPERYTALLGRHTLVAYAPEDFLADVDGFLYITHYLRAWMFAAQLRQYLVETFDEDWYLNPRTGSFLRSWWEWGQRYTAEELLAQIGGSLELTPLVRRLHEAFA